jgi:hypothetical protein
VIALLLTLRCDSVSRLALLTGGESLELKWRWKKQGYLSPVHSHSCFKGVIGLRELAFILFR